MRELKVKLIKRFKSHGRTCIVVEVDTTDEAKKVFRKISEEINKKCGYKKEKKGIMEKLFPYCNGYIETRDKRHYDKIPVSEELTFKDTIHNLLLHIDLEDLEFTEFVGFDTNHPWNKRETKKPEYSIKKCRQITKELNKVEKIGVLNRFFNLLGKNYLKIAKNTRWIWVGLTLANGWFLYKNPSLLGAFCVGWCIAFFLNSIIYYQTLKLNHLSQKLMRTLYREK